MFAPMHPRPALLAVLLVASTPFAGALDPFGDDAGSGGDAGDSIETALLVTPGEHQGRLRPLLGDDVDAYAFDAQAGDLLHLDVVFPDRAVAFLYVYDPQGGRHSFSSASFHQHILLPEAGRYTLLISGSGLSVDRPYTLKIELEASAGFTHFPSNRDWQALEAEWTEPGWIHVRLEKTLTPGEGDGIRGMTSVELDLTLENGLRIVFGFRSAWRGSDRGNTFEVKSPLLPHEVSPVKIEQSSDGGIWTVSTTEWSKATGRVRVVSLAANRDGPAEISIASSAPLTHRTEEGDGLVLWSTADADSPERIRAPGIALVGERDLVVDVDAPFYGHFWTADTSGSYTSPDGTTHALGTGDSRFFSEPAQGQWRFHLDETRAVGSPHSQYLLGAFIPHLGLHTSPLPG